MNSTQSAPAPQSPECQAAIDAEITLLNWVIAEAQQAHEGAKAHAAKNGKPMPVTALRLVIQAQHRRMCLLGIAPQPKRGKNVTAEQLAADLAQTRGRLLTESAETQPALGEAISTMSTPYLNRAQRRALQRNQGKRKAA